MNNCDIARIKAQISCMEFLQKSELGSQSQNQGYICVLCGSGTGDHKTGAVTFYPDEQRWFCYSCNQGGDVIDLYQHINGVDAKTAIAELARKAEHLDPKNAPAQGGGRQVKRNAAGGPPPAPALPEAPIDYTSFFLQANKRLDETTYHRGISRQTLDRFQVGYDPSWQPPQRNDVPPKPCLIIPISKHHYLARDARPNLTGAQKHYDKMKVGKVTAFFNEAALWKIGGPVFITEGELDALSIEDVGGAAVSLGSASHARKFIALCQERKPNRTLVICMDNDDKGRKASKELMAGLKAINVSCFERNISENYKDPNDLLMADRQALDKNIKNIKDDLKQEVAKDLLFFAADNFWNATEQMRLGIPTGFDDLDYLLDGGLYPGLYIIGAISSFGKTTFALQIADHIAKCGNDSLIFSLEMSKYELMAKTISRLTFDASKKTYGNYENAKTTRQILFRGNYNYNKEEKRFIEDVFFDFYHSIAQHAYIIEGTGDINVISIRDKVKKYILAGIRPVVFVDYLQIISPYELKGSDKQNTDKAVLELKRLSRDFNIPVIAISSFNRANYNEDASMAAFKESGAIEYSSDVLIALQFNVMSDKDKNAKKDDYKNFMDKNYQNAADGKSYEIELKVLKNRNGKRGNILLDFYPKFNIFKSKAWNSV